MGRTVPWYRPQIVHEAFLHTPLKLLNAGKRHSSSLCGSHTGWPVHGVFRGSSSLWIRSLFGPAMCIARAFCYKTN